MVPLQGVGSQLLLSADFEILQVISLSDLLLMFIYFSHSIRAEASVERLSELNPYVTMKCIKSDIREESDLSFMKQFQCIVLTDTDHRLMQRVDEYCRSQSPPIQVCSTCTWCSFNEDINTGRKNWVKQRGHWTY